MRRIFVVVVQLRGALDEDVAFPGQPKSAQRAPPANARAFALRGSAAEAQTQHLHARPHPAFALARETPKPRNQFDDVDGVHDLAHASANRRHALKKVQFATRRTGVLQTSNRLDRQAGIRSRACATLIASSPEASAVY